MDAKLYQEMYWFERRHWWFKAKRRIVLSLLDRLLSGQGRPRVCDVGCGCGMMLRDLLERGFDAVGFDSSPAAVEYCTQRGVPAVLGSCGAPEGAVGEGFDALLMLDVLEHIADDRGAYVSATHMLRPGGVLLCTVPAHPWLWTRRDEFHHHKRRYTEQRLRRLLGSAPACRVVFLSPMNSLLFPFALGQRLVSRLTDRPRAPGDLRMPPHRLNQVLEWVFACERAFLSRGISMPFGLSLIGAVRSGRPACQAGTAA